MAIRKKTAKINRLTLANISIAWIHLDFVPLSSKSTRHTHCHIDSHIFASCETI